MEKVKISYKVGNSIEEIKNKLGEEHLYKIEWLMSHYRNTTREDKQLQNAINTVVDFIKDKEGDRKVYFRAIVEGYEKDKPFSYSEFTYEDKEQMFNKYVEMIKGYFFSEHTHGLGFEFKRDPDLEFVRSGRGLPAIGKITENRVSVVLNVNGGVIQ